MAQEKVITWTNSRRKLSELIPWERNPRQIKKDKGSRLVTSYEKFNQTEMILIEPDNGLLNGHQRLKVWGAKYGGDLDVEVRVASRKLTEDEKEQLTVYLHEGAIGEWDFDLVANFDMDNLKEAGFDFDLHGLDFGGAEPAEDPGAQVDKAEELREKWGVETGQLWQLGEHRLICGDCTDPAVVERVMQGEKAQLVYTDPPYGVDYDGGTKVREKLDGDTNTDLYMPACQVSADFSDDKAALFLWHAGVKGIAAAAAAAAAAAGYEIRCEIVWNKNLAQYGALSAQYKQKHEPLYYCYKRGRAPRWFGATNEITVWDCDRASVNEFHPTQKPVELAERAMNNHSEKGDIVADWFLGSGATLIACERLGRKCRAIEISPAYVAVALQRYFDMTGKTPELVEQVIAR